MGYSDLDYSAISAFMATINGMNTKNDIRNSKNLK
jgi:hypothetical protein